MIERLHLSTVLLVASVIWGMLLVVNGIAVDIRWLHHLSAVTGLVLLLLAAFDLYLWRWKLLHPWFVGRPVVDGTWRAELRSNWKDPQGGDQAPLIAGFMVIRQTFSRLSLRLITAESRSELLGAEILRSDDGTYRITGTYRNEPRMSVRHKSQIHYGALALQVCGTPVERLEGHYWTDRNTAGEITLIERRGDHVDDVRSAERLYGITP